MALFERLFQKMTLLTDTLNWWVSRFYQKEPDLWVFGALRGEAYIDNPKYLFEYVNDHTDTKAVWISKNADTVAQIQKRGYPAFLENTKEAKQYAKKAKVAVISHRGNRKKGDLPFHYFSDKTRVIQLWHGIPLKKIAYDDTLFSFKIDEKRLTYRLKMQIVQVLFPFLNYVHRPAMMIAPGEETQRIFAKAFRLPKERVKVTGYPRNDILITNKSRTPTQKRLIYMPTFRGDAGSGFDLFLSYGFDVEKMDAFLEKHDIYLDIKLHPFNRPTDMLMAQLERSSRISLLEEVQIYEILHHYMILITDYSSIFFDYLLLERPVIFAPFDKTQYLENDRTFYFDYDEVTPGPKASDWDEVITHIETLMQEPQRYSQEREAVKERFHRYEDNKSAQRVYEAIRKL